jgi:hypothetical protein
MDEICRKYKVYAMLSTQRWTSVDELASLSRRKQRVRVRAKPDVFEYNETGSTRGAPNIRLSQSN